MAIDQTELLAKVQHHLAQHPELHTPEAIATAIRAQVPGVIGDQDVLALMRRLRQDTVGLGPLEPLLRQTDVTDIVVNGPENVWVDRGHGMQRVDVRFHDDEDVRRLASRLIVACGGRLDSAQSFADARFQKDSTTAIRVHAILSPPSDAGTCLSLRVLRQTQVTLDSLRATGTFDEHMAQSLRELVMAQRSFMVVGGTGSGKTTLLSALLSEVPDHQRIITIEDTAELRPNHIHHVPLITRPANTEGKGEITMQDLLKQALRMRPDRIVVGEIRGPEVVDLLAALNTGHEGCAGTVHANAASELPARLAALAALGGMHERALGAQISAAAPVVLAMQRTAKGRILHGIAVVESNPPQVRPVWDASTGWQGDRPW